LVLFLSLSCSYLENKKEKERKENRKEKKKQKERAPFRRGGLN